MDIANDKELMGIFSLFFDDEPISAKMIDTSREYSGIKDIRHTFIIDTLSGEKRVIKLCKNSFTTPERIAVWQRTAEEYIGLGYYCPRIIADRHNGFPSVKYKGDEFTAFAEEFSKYKPFEERDDSSTGNADNDEIFRAKWLMSAKAAAKHFDYTDYPSGYCLFERFCETDKNDEVLDDALEWKQYADALPEEFQGQVERIWDKWIKNRDALERVYPALPTSVFQADLNSTNLLVDDNGRFVGVFDFNLCGRECFLNYLFRENYKDSFESEISLIKKALEISSEEYTFSNEEREYALMLYRCLKPLRKAWIVKELKESGDKEKTAQFLEETEMSLTTEIDLKTSMNGGKSV